MEKVMNGFFVVVERAGERGRDEDERVWFLFFLA